MTTWQHHSPQGFSPVRFARALALALLIAIGGAAVMVWNTLDLDDDAGDMRKPCRTRVQHSAEVIEVATPRPDSERAIKPGPIATGRR